MGNASSDTSEADVYKYIKWIPAFGTAYSAVRTIVKAAQGKSQEAINSIWGTFGAPGVVISTIANVTASETHTRTYSRWKGGTEDYCNINSLDFDKHPLFDPHEYTTLVTDCNTNAVQKAWNFTGEDMKAILGATSNIPVACSGIRQLSGSNPFVSDAMLTTHLVILNTASNEVLIAVTTYVFQEFDLLRWTQLDNARQERIKALLENYQRTAYETNMEILRNS